LEGRYSLYSTNLIKFNNCELSFRPSKKLVRPRGPSKTIEVSGQIAKDGGRLYFSFDRIRGLPSDIETVRLRQTQFRNPNPEDWYALADWARNRAKFYDDKQLASEAESAYVNGIHLERRQLKHNLPAQLLRLAEQAAKFQLPESLRLEFLHEAHYLSWQELREVRKDTAKLIERVAKDLPGSTVPLKTAQPQMQESYFKAPVSVYRKSDEQQRNLLHRMFYGRVVLEHILNTAEPDGSNGFKTAQLIDQRLAEMHELAESYRDRELDYRLSNVANASRRDMSDLTDQFRSRNNEQKARETVANWMTAREQLLRKEGPEGLLQLAQEYLEIMKDPQTAAKLLMEADKKLPDAKEIVARLDRLGYVKVNGQWENKQQLEIRPENEIDRAMREGIVVVGMTAKQVRKTLGGPNSIARIATEGKIAEVWIYGERNSSLLVIQLVRRIQRPQAKVVGISQVPSQ